MTRRARIALLGITVGMALSVPLPAASQRDALPRIGPAPAFTLTTQDGKRRSLSDLRGKVLAITFI